MGQGPVCVDNRAERRWGESGCDASLRRCRSCSTSLFDSQNRKKLQLNNQKRRRRNKMINVIEHTKILISPPLCISSVNKFSSI